MFISLLLTIGLIGAVFAFGNRILSQQGSKVANLKLDNQILDEQQLQLRKTQKDVEQYSSFTTVANQVIPQDKDQARAIREILAIAKESNITIKNITFPASTLGDKKTTTSSTTEQAATPAPTVISQAKPVDGISGVMQLEITISPELTEKALVGGEEVTGVSYDDFLQFLEKLESNRRTAHVAQVNVTPQTATKTAPLIDFTMKLNVFIKP
jgi:hypothetical protein